LRRRLQPRQTLQKEESAPRGNLTASLAVFGGSARDRSANIADKVPSSTLLVRGVGFFCPPADDARNPAQGAREKTGGPMSRCAGCRRAERSTPLQQVRSVSPLDRSVIAPAGRLGAGEAAGRPAVRGPGPGRSLLTHPQALPRAPWIRRRRSVPLDAVATHEPSSWEKFPRTRNGWHELFWVSARCMAGWWPAGAGTPHGGRCQRHAWCGMLRT
jgi:hypothetical protein